MLFQVLIRLAYQRFSLGLGQRDEAFKIYCRCDVLNVQDTIFSELYGVGGSVARTSCVGLVGV